jgi:hypothetical protein
MMFKKLKEENKQFPSIVSANKRKTLKNTRAFFFWGGGGRQVFAGYRFSRGVLERNPREKGGMSVLELILTSSLILKLNYSYWF